MSNALLQLSLFLGGLSFGCWRIFRYLQFLQQEEYDPKRFVHWVQTNGAYDRRGSTIALTAALAMLILPNHSLLQLVVSLLVLGALEYFVVKEPDPRKDEPRRYQWAAWPQEPCPIAFSQIQQKSAVAQRKNRHTLGFPGLWR